MAIIQKGRYCHNCQRVTSHQKSVNGDGCSVLILLFLCLLLGFFGPIGWVIAIVLFCLSISKIAGMVAPYQCQICEK